MNLILYSSICHNGDVALVDADNNTALIAGNTYHSGTVDQLIGFRLCLEHLGIQYEVKDVQIADEHPMWDIIGFSHESD